MALRFCDSFDHYATAQMTLKWTEQIASPTVGAFGRNTTNGLQCDTVANGLSKVLDSQATWIVGVAFTINTHPTAAVPLLTLYDTTTRHVDVRVTTGGLLQVTRDGTQIGIGTTVLSINTYYYLEFKATIADSPNGSATVRLNGVDEVTVAADDTRNAGNASANTIQLAGVTAGACTGKFDDLYICDATGGVNDDFLGDIRVQTILPSGNGNSSQFDGSDGNSTDNYLLVDEATPDGDTTYVETAVATEKDTYAFGNVTPTSGDIFGVQILPYARKTDAGTRTIASVARLSGGTEADGPNKPLTTTYIYWPDVRETKPGGGSWTITDVNDAEFGVKVTA